MSTPSPWISRSYIAIAAMLFAISAGHYLTGSEHSVYHDVLRRLYYLPVVWGALVAGLRGGLLTAAITVCLYLPHAFLLPMHRDPGGGVDKAAELVMYVVVGALAGLLVDRERAAMAVAARQAVERLRAQDRAARADSVAHLARGLAHEIRNPLGGIQGAIEILAAAVPPDSAATEMADVGIREIERLDRVIAEFMSFARPRPADIRAVSLAAIAKDTVALLGAEGDTASVQLSVHIHGDAVEALADRDHLVQIVVNLVRNAIQATPAAGAVRVDATSLDSNRVRIEVSDNGRGVDPALGNAIYDPYVTGRDDGTGLGLAIAATLAARQNGKLGHRVRPGGGTIFCLELPAASLEHSKDV